MKTPSEIQALIENWIEDPCWDIEDTEGFEDHKDILLKYRLWYEDYSRLLNEVGERRAKVIERE